MRNGLVVVRVLWYSHLYKSLEKNYRHAGKCFTDKSLGADSVPRVDLCIHVQTSWSLHIIILRGKQSTVRHKIGLNGPLGP